MRIPRLYYSGFLAPGMTIQLEGNAFSHAVRVLRIRPGGSIVLFNNQGGEYSAQLKSIDKRRAEARIKAFKAREVESPLHITLGQCIAKPEHMDTAIQKATELGARTIVPLLSQRSLKLDSARLGKKHSHWQGIIISACEQCGRNHLPQLAQPIVLEDWLGDDIANSLQLLLDPQAGQSLRSVSHKNSIRVLIGPEGGLTETEIQQAQDRGFIGIKMGPRILRTETAALTILAALNTLWGDF